MKTTILFAIADLKLWFTAFLLQLEPINNFIVRYLIADTGFLKWLFIAMMLDLITGIAKAWSKKESITSKGLRDTIVKFIQYGSFLIITHVVTHYEIAGVAVSNYSWVNKFALEFILLIEAKSVYENIVAINPKFDFIKTTLEKIIEAFSKKK